MKKAAMEVKLNDILDKIKEWRNDSSWEYHYGTTAPDLEGILEEIERILVE